MMYIGRISAQLILWHSVPVDLPSSHRIIASSAGIRAVSLDGVNGSAVAFFHQSHVIRATVAAPVEENQITGAWLVASVLPLVMRLEPAYATPDGSEFRYCPALNISALVCAP